MGGAMIEVLALPVAPGVPLLLVAGLAVPLTVLLSRHPLRLVGFGGAMVYSLDSAVLGFLLWTTTTTAATAGQLTAPGGGGLVPIAGAAWLPWLLGYVLSEAAAHQRRAAVRGYNILLSALAGLVFVAVALSVRAGVARLVDDDYAPVGVGVWDLVAVVLASGAYVGVDLLLSAVYVARVEGGRIGEVLADPAGIVAAGTVLAVNATAVLAAVLLTVAPWGLLLLVPVAVALVHATRTSTAVMGEHARARALYRGAVGCQAATTRDEVVEAVCAAAEDAAVATAVLRDTGPDDDQVGVAFDDEGVRRWLVVGPRRNRHAFDRDDEAALATLAALAEQALARVGAMERVREVAERDALTGVLNRGAVMSLVEQTVTPDSAVLFCDVDHFKSVNDTFGHRVGDQVLVSVARTLQEVVGADGTVGRVGGDEFVVLLPRTDAVRTEELRTTILQAMEPPVRGAGQEELRVGLSIGVAGVAELRAVATTDPADLAEALLEKADLRMYDDKRSGRRAGS